MYALDESIYAALPTHQHAIGQRDLVGLTAAGMLAASLFPSPGLAETKSGNSRAVRVATASATIIRPYEVVYPQPSQSKQADRNDRTSTRTVTGECTKLLGPVGRDDIGAAPRNPDGALCELILIELQ